MLLGLWPASNLRFFDSSKNPFVPINGDGYVARLTTGGSFVKASVIRVGRGKIGVINIRIPSAST